MLEIATFLLRSCDADVVRRPAQRWRATLLLLGLNLALSVTVESTEWFETFDDDRVLDDSSPETSPRWSVHRENGSGSYFVGNGKLLASFGPCPHQGRSLYFWPRLFLDGDVTVDVAARLPDEGKLIAFAHGDNRTSGYRGVLHPSGQLDLVRLDSSGEVLLGSTRIGGFGASRSIHLELRSTGDRVLLATYGYSPNQRSPRVEVVDTTYRSGNAGAGIQHPGYGEYGEFEAIRIVEAAQQASTTTAAPRTFLRGDCNSDGTVDIFDAICIVGWLFAGERDPECVASTNANGDDAGGISDATYLLHFLFAGGPAPVAPFPDCGPSTLPVDDEPGCASSSYCQ